MQITSMNSKALEDTVKRLDVIMKIVDRIVIIDNETKPELIGAGAAGKDQTAKPKKESKPLFLKPKNTGKVRITQFQYNALNYLLKRKLEGMDVMDPMILDPNIEDISCSGVGNIFVEHKIFGGLRSSIGFESEETLDKFVIELAEGIKHPVTFRDPVVDATLPDGSRINIVYGNDVSKRGSNFTIRKFPIRLEHSGTHSIWRFEL